MRGCSDSPVVKTALPLQGEWVWSLARELRSHASHGMTRNKQKHQKKKRNVHIKWKNYTAHKSDLNKAINGFPGGSAGKESSCNAGDPGSIPGLRRSPGEGKGYPLQYSGLKNSMEWIDRLTKTRTQLSDFHFTFKKSHKERDYYTLVGKAKRQLTLPRAEQQDRSSTAGEGAKWQPQSRTHLCCVSPQLPSWEFPKGGSKFMFTQKPVCKCLGQLCS